MGVLYYELLFGKLPFTGVNEDDLLKNILKNQLRIPPCSKLSEDFLKGALVIDENARWGWENIFELFYGPGQGKFQGNQQGQWANRVPEPQQNNLFYRK